MVVVLNAHQKIARQRVALEERLKAKQSWWMIEVFLMLIPSVEATTGQTRAYIVEAPVAR